MTRMASNLQNYRYNHLKKFTFGQPPNSRKTDLVKQDVTEYIGVVRSEVVTVYITPN